VFEGTPEELERADTATGRALREERDFDQDESPGLLLRVAEAPAVTAAPSPAGRKGRAGPTSAPRVRVVGARANNLRNVSAEIPLGKLVGICGVSGSGKSSLAVDVLVAGARQRMGKGFCPASTTWGSTTRSRASSA